MEDEAKKKPHRPSKLSKKLEGKKKKGSKGRKEKDESLDPKIRNPKAFAFNSAVRAERRFRRTQDLETNKERAPLVDRTPVDLPPFIVALVGPPKVGKSTLFQNLIRNFTRQTLTDIKGPVTVISGKKRRLTLIECNNDINSMIDIAKVADLVLLLVDASFGFEMEIFEFLNICQVHGFPQIMGVLTHLDLFKNKDHLKKTKKILKHRFWTEVYPGSKLFYLSGYHPMNNSYPKNEIHNLARFISIMKFRPTLWRTEHAYVVADRIEDLTPPESIHANPKIDRTVCLYGFVHGTFLKPHVSVHIPGLGDYTPQAVTALEDPCPLPRKESVLRRCLNEKERMIYAPFSGVGGIVYDQDAVYIDLGGSHSHNHNRRKTNKDENEVDPPIPFISELRDLKSTLNEKMDSAGFRLFSTSEECFTSADLEVSNNENGSEDDEAEIPDHSDNPSSNEVSAEEDDDLSSNKKRRYDEAENAFYSRFKTRSLQKMIYDDTGDYVNMNSNADFDLANCFVQEVEEDSMDEMDEEIMKQNFVGGDYAETAKNLLDEDDNDAFGDFEELDGNDTGKLSENADLHEEMGNSSEIPEIKMQSKREDMKKKLKEKFDMDYDEGGGDKSFYKDWKTQVEEQTKVNRTFFDNIDDSSLLQDLQGFAPGSYVRIEIGQLPYEFMVNFDAQTTSPLVIGSLDTPNQETLSVLQARVKKHRWHPKILKSRDPIILSVGWRRFQTISLYSVHDHNLRNRMVKYTPEHLHCIANFYGPITPQGTGILGIAPRGFDGFRIVLTGTILDMDKSTQLVKKLKLIGSPSKVFKKSAFIDGMFTSQLEVTKFIGARIKSVSGVRGVVKKPLRTPEGSFRATFEDKILTSDIIFCRTWANVDVPKFFLNLPTHVIEQPRVVKTLGQLKREQQIHANPNPDNLYTPIERQVKAFRPLKVPKSLQEKLPYKDKPKIQAKLNEQKRIAVIKEPHERKMSQMLKVMKTRMGEKEQKEKIEKAKKSAEREKVMKRLEEKQTYRQKELRKKVFRTLGLMNKNKPDSVIGNSTSGGRGRGGGKFTKRRR